jgi:hypothetical protein
MQPEHLVQVSLAPSRQRTDFLMITVFLGETTSGTDWHIIFVAVM